MPRSAQLKISTPGMVELLVKSLYGESFSSGIEGLLQNAIDAVLELRDIRKSTPNAGNRAEAYPIQGDVHLSISTDESGADWLSCVDIGRGMSESVIVDHFLTIGSSFCTSETWRQTHMPTGQVDFARSGRFGLGILAAFLLGNRIRCVTRAYDEDQGIAFEATADAGPIELQRVDAPFGTSVAVELSRGPMEYLRSHGEFLGWYYGTECEITFGEGISVADRFFSVASQATSPPADGWLRLPQTEYEAVDWSPVHRYLLRDRRWMLCNGLLVGPVPHAVLDISKQADKRSWCILKHVTCPQVSFVDGCGRLPLRLDRRGLTDEMPFTELITQQAIDNIIACWLVGFGRGDHGIDAEREYLPSHPLEVESCPEVETPTGVRLFDAFTADPAHELATVFQLGHDPEQHPSSTFEPLGFATCLRKAGRNVRETLEWMQQVVGGHGSQTAWVDSESAWIALGSYWHEDSNLLASLANCVTSKLTPEPPIGKMAIYRIGDRPMPEDIRKLLAEQHYKSDPYLRLAICNFKQQPRQNHPSMVARRWQELIGAEIPFDANERTAMIERLRRDAEFRKHIEFWEADRSILASLARTRRRPLAEGQEIDDSDIPF